MKTVRFIYIFLFTALLYGCGESDAKLQLPDSATEVREFHSSSWNGDYVRLIKAKLTYEDFKTYANALQLSDHFKQGDVIDGELRSTLLLGAGDSPSWWDPPKNSSVKEIYYSYPKKENVQSLIWDKGYVYYRDLVW